MPKIGDKVEVNKVTYTVNDIVQNIDGAPIIIWRSKKDTGGCTPSLWNEWVEGFSQYRRRGQFVPEHEFYDI